MAKQRQVKMQQRVGTLGAIQQLESRSDEQLLSESKHRAAARAILGARAAERYDAKAARRYFNEALAGAHPQERPMSSHRSVDALGGTPRPSSTSRTRPDAGCARSG